MSVLTRHKGRLLPILTIAALVLPSVAWIFIDKRVWHWDPAYYGYWIMQSVHAMDGGVGAWLEINLHSLRMMPPLITWLGQFFVPLRHVTGDLDTALLMLIVLMTVATLAVVYATARDLAAAPDEMPGIAVGLAAVAVCGGAPLFIGLSHHFLTEIPQCLAAALSVAAAWRVERRSSVRTAAFVILMVVVAFLAKASSLTFVLPALVYIAVALVVTRRDVRPAAVRADWAWLAAAVAGLALTLIWYAANWDVMATHFVQASVGEEVQNYADAAALPVKLELWALALADGLALTRVVPLVLALGTIAVLGVSVFKLRAASRPLHAAVTGGVLFALYLAGTIVAVVFAYALQINEDPRYILALIPIAAVLVAWTLTVLNRQSLAFVVTAVFMINAAMVHAGALGVDVPKRHNWVWVADASTAEAEALSYVVTSTCKVGETHGVAIGVSYPWMNANSANYDAGKRRLTTDARCVYHFVPQEDLERSLAWMDTAKVRYLVTVPPAQQDPENFANVLSKPLAEYAAASPDFELMPEAIARYRIYRRLNGAF